MFEVEDLLIDNFYFDKSTKRKNGLAEFCSFCDSQYRQLIKHVNTRWLSLSTAVNRTLSQYAGLRSYFLSQGNAWWKLYALNIPHVIDECNSRFQRLHRCYSDPMTEVYLFFYQAALQQFVRLNLLLQREDPIVHIISDRLHNFLKTLFGKFVSVRVIKEAENMTAVAYERENQLEGMMIMHAYTCAYTYSNLQ